MNYNSAYLKAVSQRLPRRVEEVQGNLSEELNSKPILESWTSLLSPRLIWVTQFLKVSYDGACSPNVSFRMA